ncbi:MAG: bifunctional oligoribonuclease/PAP phosphatase NrnA [Chloroflexaceae bacterium]|jgi:phosphoesterase RecJ-like protein|nr:bifunctional oligoribonuclease/PAP phosphatase NrnA [Chloroflexaceae bacterium]
MIYTDYAAAAPAFADLLNPAQRILLLTHVNPDGDAIGSMLGVWHCLRAMGKTAIPLASSAIPGYTSELPGIEHVQVYSRGMPLPEADLIWLVDTATLDRIGQIYTDHHDTLAARPLVIVDHHVTNEGGGNLNLITPQSASCAELLFRLLRAMELPVPPEAATCFLMGVVTDTQSFQTSSSNPQSLRTTADLLEAGADNQAVVQAVYFSTPYSTIRLTGAVLETLQHEDGLYWAVVPQALMRETGAADEATDEATIRLQRVEGLRAAVLFKERADGTVKISLRSKPGIDVAAIAKRWGGGGHTQAAGATLHMNLDEAQQAVLPVLREALAHAQ